MNEENGRHELVEVHPGVYIHLYRVCAGSNGLPLLFIHGNRDNHTHFLPLLAHLAERDVVLVDLRGHGLSSPLREPASPGLFAEDIRRVLDHLHISRAVLVGHSLGSVVSMTLADLVPKRVAGLVLMGTAAIFELSFKRPTMELTEESFPDFITEANRRAGSLFFRPEYPDVSARVLATWATMSFESHRHLVKMRHPDLRATVPSLPGPVLVIAGENDQCTPVAGASWIADHHPRAQLVVIPSTGHFMYLEEPDAVAQAIDRFLKKPQSDIDRPALALRE